MKKVTYTLGLLSLMIGALLLTSARAMATSPAYTDEVELQFSWSSELSLSLSSAALTISNLAPGNAGESSDVTITVTTTNATGYNLTATVGSAANASTNLTKDASNVFQSVATDADLTLANLGTDGRWGYSTDAGSSYSGLPLYTAAGKELRNIGAAVTDGSTANAKTSFRIGAKAASTQVAGDYTNVINFVALANVESD